MISGYLITRLIINEHNSPQGFRFSKFYTPCTPSLSRFTYSLCDSSGGKLCSRQMILKELAAQRCIQLQAFSISTFGLSGYFNPSAKVKPLLHTWSLGGRVILSLMAFILVTAVFIPLKVILAVAFLSIIGLGLVAPTWTYHHLFSHAVPCLRIHHWRFIVSVAFWFYTKYGFHEVSLISGLVRLAYKL